MAIIKISVFKFLPYLISFIDYLFHDKWIFEPLKLQIYQQKCLSGILVMDDKSHLLIQNLNLKNVSANFVYT